MLTVIRFVPFSLVCCVSTLCRLNNRRYVACRKTSLWPWADLKHSITVKVSDEWKKRNGTKTVEKQAKRKRDKHLNPSVGLPSHPRVDSLAAPIHLRSPHSGVFREGQNPENRLHTRHFVAGHPSPASQHRGAAHNWDTAAAKNTSGGAELQRGSAATQHAFTQHSFCISAAFVVLSEDAWDRNKVTFGCLRQKNLNLFKCRRVRPFPFTSFCNQASHS